MDWQTIVNITARMQTHAAAQQWEDVLQLSAERQTMLEVFFSGLALKSEAERQQLRQDVETLLASDQTLMATAVEVKTIVGAELSRLSAGRKATEKYQGFQDSN